LYTPSSGTVVTVSSAPTTNDRTQHNYKSLVGFTFAYPKGLTFLQQWKNSDKMPYHIVRGKNWTELLRKSIAYKAVSIFKVKNKIYAVLHTWEQEHDTRYKDKLVSH